MPGPLFTSLLQRASSAMMVNTSDPQRLAEAQRHRQALRHIAAADIKYVRATVHKVDESARKIVTDAFDRTFNDSWLQAVIAECKVAGCNEAAQEQQQQQQVPPAPAPATTTTTITAEQEWQQEL